MNTGILEFEDGPYQQGGEDGPWAFAIDAACLTEDGPKKVDHPMSANTISEFGISKDSGVAQVLRDRLIAPRSVFWPDLPPVFLCFFFTQDLKGKRHITEHKLTLWERKLS